MSRERTEEAEPRTKRQPLGVMRRKMTLDQASMARIESSGLVPRWVNDDDHGGRLRDAIAGGYNFLASDGSVLVGDTQKAAEKNRRVKKLVGTNKDGSPKQAYLMAIKREFYEEDQQKKEDQNMMVDEAIRGGNPRGLKQHGVKPDQGSTYVKDIQYKP